MEDPTFYTESSPPEEIVSSFSSEGVVFLKDIIPLSDIEIFYRFAEAHFERSKDARDHFVCVMRSFGRYELTLLDSRNNDIPDVSRIVNKLEPFIPKLLGGNYKSMLPLKLSSLSIQVTTPGSPEELSMHADGGHASLQQHLPAYATNVVIPLHDEDIGSTEFRPESHFAMTLAAKCRGELRVPISPPLRKGSIICFDYRM